MADEQEQVTGGERRRGASIRLAMTLWNVGVLALVLVGFDIALGYTVREHIVRDTDRHIARIAHQLQRGFAFGPALSAGRSGGGRRRFGGPLGGPYPPALLSASGQKLAPFSAQTPWDPKAFALALAGQAGYSTVQLAGTQIRVFSAPISRAGRVIGAVQVPHDMADLAQALAWVNETLLALIPLALLIAGLGGAFLTSRALRPVRQIAQAAERIEAGNLSGRLPVAGHDEFTELAVTFNHMLARLEGAFRELEEASEQQRRFTGDASHELKTPLTIIKANTSLALSGERTPEQYSQALGAIDQAADRMNRLVQDLLLLARSDSGQMELRAKSVPLKDVLDEANEAIRVLHGRSAAIEIGTPDLAVLGDHEMLVRLFTNLLGNAARYTPAKGSLRIQAQPQPGSLVAICVSDTGVGIAPEHLAHLTDRFYRVDPARSSAQGGAGLGLAICQTIVAAHHGRMEIESTVGSGTSVTVTLPQGVADAARVPEVPARPAA